MSNGSASKVSSSDYQALKDSYTVLQQELTLLKYKYDELREHLFGRKSEKKILDSAEQLNMFPTGQAEPLSEEGGDDEYIDVNYKRKKRVSKKSFPDDLPVDEVVYEPTETHCSECGTELKEFSRDVREEIDFEPARFFKRQIVRVNCSCPGCDKVSSGQTPSPVIPGTQLGAGFFAHLITSRFCDHLPYYRQSQIYEREGVIIPDKSLSNYAQIIGGFLEPVAKEIKKRLLSLNYVQVDETRLDVLEKDKTHRGQLWVINDPRSKLLYYEYHDSRSKKAALALLGSYSGALQTDAYSAYTDYSGVSLGCMGHARRYFVKARKIAPQDAKHIIKLISNLYGIEKRLAKLRINLKQPQWYDKRFEVRQDEALPILEKIKEYLIQAKDKYLIQEHPMTKAINYMLSRFQTFCTYTTDGRYQIDNNDVERIIRPVAIGRNNWLFAGSHNAAKINAVMMTVVQNCRQLKVNPYLYLRDVLPKLASHNTTSLEGLTPMDWVRPEKQ